MRGKVFATTNSGGRPSWKVVAADITYSQSHCVAAGTNAPRQATLYIII